MEPQASQKSLASSWRSGKLKDSYDGSFNRLPDWTSNNVAVQAGTATGSEEYEIGGMFFSNLKAYRIGGWKLNTAHCMGLD